MTIATIRPRRPQGADTMPSVIRDAAVTASHLTDAAHFPGGHLDGVVVAHGEAEVAAVLRHACTVLPIGAQSSLTGGATPMGETVLTTSRMNRIVEIARDRVRVEAGVALSDLDAALAAAGKYYPPAPTFTGAFVGGTVATNAAGAATFKYGTTREWVLGLTVVLPNGDVLDIKRGAARAGGDATLEIVLSDRTIAVPVPQYRMPQVPKCSAGYYAAPDMDMIDLFIGSEGTLGVITAATLRIVAPRPSQCLAFFPVPSTDAALALVRRLRDAARETWRTRDPAGLDVAAIEHMDRRCLTLLREDGIDRLHGVRIPDSAALALLVTVELPPGTTAAAAYDQLGRSGDAPLARFCRELERAGALDDVQVAMPGETRRTAQLLAVREAVPAAVNARVARAQLTIDARIAKTAADVIVPFDRLEQLLTFGAAEFERRRLDAATWGHISDGNLHANVIPRTIGDVESGREAILAIGREAIRLGGSPLAEHGVGRHPVKQQLLRELYGQEGIDQMRRIKAAVDPEWKMAPGVIFPDEGRS
jgi:D-lactate dehydrogenase (cytochrome)